MIVGGRAPDFGAPPIFTIRFIDPPVVGVTLVTHTVGTDDEGRMKADPPTPRTAECSSAASNVAATLGSSHPSSGQVGRLRVPASVRRPVTRPAGLLPDNPNAGVKLCNLGYTGGMGVQGATPVERMLLNYRSPGEPSIPRITW